jgi:hypothetical protein
MAEKEMNKTVIYSKISDILHNDWNPTGIADLPRDEYEAYVPQMLELKKSGASEETIASTLNKIETGKMGLTGSMEHCRRTAAKIMDLPDFFA